MKRRCLAALLTALCVVPARSAHAEKLLDFSGRVALLDGKSSGGVKVKLQVDLNRNRELESFETLSASVKSDGSYQLSYELDPRDVDFEFLEFVTKLVAAFKSRGFAALLDDGPLPVVLSFEREGYSTVVKRLTTLSDAPSLDVVLAPLRAVACADGRCLSADGSVQLSGFPGGTGIARAYAQAYDPGDETARFPGSFSDDEGNLLKSSGFAEINLHDAEGNEIHELSSPVAARFEAKRASWHTMPDLTPESGRIELPMYSFDRAIGEWVREADGVLVHEDGSEVAESALAAIRAGTFAERAFISFNTRHFSTFNCDEPIATRACVKGRIVSAKGEAVVGVQVSVDGASYTGNAGYSFTGSDGRFAADVMKSEASGEDVDFNGRTGEKFQARVMAVGTGVFTGAAFDTPRVQGTVSINGATSCRPRDCACLDLGDITVDFEPPRTCQVTVEARFSGKHASGEGGPLADGAVVASANVRGTLAGGVVPPQAMVATLCQGLTCNTGTTSADGKLTFVVPLVGDSPSLALDADFSVQEGETTHYYSGSAVVSGCARGQTQREGTVLLELDHAAMQGIGSFIDLLGPGPRVDQPGQPGQPSDPLDVNDPLGCGCRVWRGSGARALHGLSLLALGLALWVRRRRTRG
jgi:hypothetical protein